MFATRLFNPVKTKMLLSDIGQPFPTISPDLNSDDTAPSAKSSGVDCCFEPVYVRKGDRFIHKGHRSIARSRFDAGDISNYLDLLSSAGDLSLRDAIGQGHCQVDLMRRHLDSFVRQYTPGDVLHLQIDLADLAQHSQKITRVIELVKSANGRSLPTDALVLELSASPALDVGELYTIAGELKQLNTRIALVDVDADTFSLSRIFVVSPDWVQFNNSWCAYGTTSTTFRRLVRHAVEALLSEHIKTAISGLTRPKELYFVRDCGIRKCSGPVLSEAAASLKKMSSVVINGSNESATPNRQLA